MLSSAVRPAGVAQAIAPAANGKPTKSPIIGNGRAIATMPAALAAAHKPIQRPMPPASSSLVVRGMSMKMVSALTSNSIKKAVMIVPMKSTIASAFCTSAFRETGIVDARVGFGQSTVCRPP
jgi:hypothetical protein